MVDDSIQIGVHGGEPESWKREKATEGVWAEVGQSPLCHPPVHKVAPIFSDRNRLF